MVSGEASLHSGTGCLEGRCALARSHECANKKLVGMGWGGQEGGSDGPKRWFARSIYCTIAGGSAHLFLPLCAFLLCNSVLQQAGDNGLTQREFPKWRIFPEGRRLRILLERCVPVLVPYM